MIDRHYWTTHVAYHESGHAVLAYLLHYPITEIRVFVSDYDYEGAINHTDAQGIPLTQNIENKVLILCGGNAAQYLLTGTIFEWHRSMDYELAAEYFYRLFRSRYRITARIDYLWFYAVSILKRPENSYAVQRLAEFIESAQEEPGYWDGHGQYHADYDHEDTHQLDGKEVEKIIREAIEDYLSRSVKRKVWFRG